MKFMKYNVFFLFLFFLSGCFAVQTDTTSTEITTTNTVNVIDFTENSNLYNVLFGEKRTADNVKSKTVINTKININDFDYYMFEVTDMYGNFYEMILSEDMITDGYSFRNNNSIRIFLITVKDNEIVINVDYTLKKLIITPVKTLSPV